MNRINFNKSLLYNLDTSDFCNRENVNYIKDWLRENRSGLLITNRQVGKSQALIELLVEESNSYLLAFSQASARNYFNKIVNLYNKYCSSLIDYDPEGFKEFKKDVKERIVHMGRNYPITALSGRPVMPTKSFWNNLYIDEYYFNKCNSEKFKGAVSTMKFPMEIKKLHVDYRCSEEELKMTYSEEQYKKEYSLDFRVIEEN